MWDFVQPLVDFVKSSAVTQHVLTASGPTILAYLIARKRNRAELDKVRAEADTHRLGHLRQLGEVDEAFREADRNLVEACTAFYRAHDGGLDQKPQFDKARDDLCAALNDVLSQKANVFRCYCHVYRNDPHDLRSLLDATISDLRLWKKYLVAINNPAVIYYLGRRPLKIKKHTLQPLRDACRGLKLDPDTHVALDAATCDLVSTGPDND